MKTLFGDSMDGLLSVFCSGGPKQFSMWEVHIRDGRMNTFLDPELKVMVTDLLGVNVTTTYMFCPKDKQVLGIHLPFLVMIVKNMKKYFTFEITVRDDTNMRRRFRVANFQSTTQVGYTSTVMPIGLAEGWNQIQFNLSEFTQKAYNRHFKEVVSIKINANIRIKRIYFSSRLIPDDELPVNFRLFHPLRMKTNRRRYKVQSQLLEEQTENADVPYDTEGIKEKPKTDSSALEKTYSTQLAQVMAERPDSQGSIQRSPQVNLSIRASQDIRESVTKQATSVETEVVERRQSQVSASKRTSQESRRGSMITQIGSLDTKRISEDEPERRQSQVSVTKRISQDSAGKRESQVSKTGSLEQNSKSESQVPKSEIPDEVATVSEVFNSKKDSQEESLYPMRRQSSDINTKEVYKQTS